MSADIQLGDHVRLTAVKPVQGGAMIAWHDNVTFFVEGALPGEDVTAKVTHVRSKFVRAQVLEVHKPHPERQSVACPAAAEGSGCCDYSFATPELQHQLKLAVVHDQLERMTELEKKFWPTTVTALSEDIQGWRIRQRYAVDDAGRVGNFRKWSHELVTRSDHQCIQEASELSDIPHIEALAPGSELVFAVGDDGQCHAVNLQYPAANKTTKRGSRSRATARRAQRAKTPQRSVLFGSGEVLQRVAGAEWTIPADCFWQAHRDAAAAYADLVTHESDLFAGDYAWDLYGGCGVFAQALRVSEPDVRGIDSVDLDPRSINAGKKVFDADKRVNITRANVLHWLRRTDTSPDVVVLDPPRAGAGKAVVESISRKNPRTILHFGCDPASFARDIADWLRSGYGVKKIHVFDGFPGTHHMECFAKLEPLS
ncbi:MAG: TRAM domain-containing protein [Lawsonella sp.]